jgi:positive regulator of sigma E activity
MVKYFKFFEYAYLIIAIIFIVETVLNWSLNRQKAYIYLAFSALAVFMYFFRKKHRKKFEDHKQ